jgi:hypothetical protein
MTSSSALSFRVPSRDNFADAQSGESRAAAKVTVKPVVTEAQASRPLVSMPPTADRKIGVHLDVKA